MRCFARPVLGWLFVLAIVACGSAALGAEKRPLNVLFLMTDQHHYDALGSSGNPIVKTPNLDKLAAGGTRFTHMYCPVPYCSPTRASIVTGRYPSSLGLGATSPTSKTIRCVCTIRATLTSTTWPLGDTIAISWASGTSAIRQS